METFLLLPSRGVHGTEPDGCMDLAEHILHDVGTLAAGGIIEIAEISACAQMSAFEKGGRSSYAW
jgi:hypothetical protein